MEASTALDLKPGSRGRKDKDGTEETIKIKPIKDACDDMMKLYKKLQSAKENFNENVKGVAERSGVNASTLKKLVRASYGGNFADVRRDVDQVSIIFDQVGEIAGGKASEE